MEKYSVLMAVYEKEREECLCLAIDSMVRQTIAPDEFVLVCNGPLTEALEHVIAQFTEKHPSLFRIIRLESNRGLGVALNIGMQYCRNELVARMDSDDIALPDRMEKQLPVMRQNPDISALGGQIAEFCDDAQSIIGFRIVPTDLEEIREFIKFRNPMNHMTVVLRKSHVLAVGSYQDVPGFEDYFLWTSLLANGYRLENLQDVCCWVRANDSLYSRRGGIRYFQNTLRVERFLLDKVLISQWQYYRNIAVRFVGTVLLPSQIRKRVFLSLLRRQSWDRVTD